MGAGGDVACTNNDYTKYFIPRTETVPQEEYGVIRISAVVATPSQDSSKLIVEWSNDSTTVPQFAYFITVKEGNTEILFVCDTIPQKRSETIDLSPLGVNLQNCSVTLEVLDMFDGRSEPVSIHLGEQSETGETDVTMFTLAATAQNGTVSFSETGSEFAEGSSITVEATPDNGYVFERWSGDLSGTVNPAAITIDSDKSITAHFITEEINYIIMPAGENNVVTILGDTLFYDDGGPLESYKSNVKGSLTLNPGVDGKAIKMVFEEFFVEDSVEFNNTAYVFDSLEIFNGSDISKSLGSWYGLNSPEVITSTASDGSLTISWISNGMNSAPGWKSRVSLVDPIAEEVGVIKSESVQYTPDITVSQNRMLISLPIAGNYSVEIFTPNGRLIHTLLGTVQHAGIQQQNLPNLATGVFVARLNVNGSTLSRRIIIK